MESNSQTLRGQIIEDSVRLERVVTLLLSDVFEIADIENSNSFQTTGNVLNFHAKTSLLSDLKYLPSGLKDKISMLYQLRNKFVHNIDVDSFKAFFEVSGNGKKKAFLGFYSDKLDEKEFENEERYFAAIYDLLMAEVLHDLEVISNLMARNLKNEVHKDSLMERIKSVLVNNEDANVLAEILNLKQEILETYPSLSFQNEKERNGEV
ncbi:hypothetical protein [Flavobacterium sp. HSC-61S13]|uniref:hypothetical protein n=1 Tax=Flavobacterium sp. HSC-61S13 TaxID=2910963 RepID=UPI0020A17591|nr:hypothetical protein [Flavobacterium sp. HSC-61S13]MCP1995464.1 hypothetical protein [Flavobacterium sp. HSC-61S13]